MHDRLAGSFYIAHIHRRCISQLSIDTLDIGMLRFQRNFPSGVKDTQRVVSIAQYARIRIRCQPQMLPCIQVSAAIILIPGHLDACRRVQSNRIPGIQGTNIQCGGFRANIFDIDTAVGIGTLQIAHQVDPQILICSTDILCAAISNEVFRFHVSLTGILALQRVVDSFLRIQANILIFRIDNTGI